VWIDVGFAADFEGCQPHCVWTAVDRPTGRLADVRGAERKAGLDGA
jgi:hypothetical protein